MGPVRIKYYGLFWITRRGYLLATAAAGAFALLAWLFAWGAGVLPPWRWPWEPVILPPGAPPAWWFYYNYSFLIYFCLVAEALDILVVLRRFARKEGEQQARLAAIDTAGFSRQPRLVPPEAVRPAPGFQEAPRTDTNLPG